MHEYFVNNSPARWNTDKPANRQWGEDAFGTHCDVPNTKRRRFQDVEELVRRIEVAVAVAA